MKGRAKKRIVLFVTLSIVLSIICIMLIFNYMMNRYIENEAKQALQGEQQTFQLDHEVDHESMIISFDTNTSMQVNMLFLTEEGTSTYPYMTDQEKRMITFINRTAPPKQVILSETIQEERIYFIWLPLHTEADVLEQSMVLYVNVTPLTTFAKTMNVLFIIVLLLCTFIASFYGFRLGKHIENTEEKMQQFFQNMSHELKTPIMSIQGYAEGIQTGIIPTEQAVDVILNESQKMEQLVEELLFLSKMESGQLHEQKEAVEWDEMIYDCVRTMDPVAKQRHLVWQLHIPDALPLFYGHEAQLTKAFSNVLTNAVHYANNTVTIAIKWDASHWYIAIQDDGPGVSEQDAPYVFDRFFKGSGGHTGIGLALAKDIVTLHQGTIRLIPPDTKHTTGALFLMTFPRND